VNPVTWSGTVVGCIRETAGDATSAQQAWRVNQILEMPLGGDWGRDCRTRPMLLHCGRLFTSGVSSGAAS
jgi:hypothetical protein